MNEIEELRAKLFAVAQELINEQLQTLNARAERDGLAGQLARVREHLHAALNHGDGTFIEDAIRRALREIECGE